MAAATHQLLGASVTVALTQRTLLPRAQRLLLAETERVDRACNRLRPDAELRRLNERRITQVSSVLAAAIRAALRVAHATQGAVNPVVETQRDQGGRDLHDASFTNADGSLAESRRLASAPLHSSRHSWQRVSVDEHNVVLLPNGIDLDLDPITRAWTADRAAQLIAHSLGCGVVVNIGGNIAAAGPPPPSGWPVRIVEHNGASQNTDQTISSEAMLGPIVTVFSGGLATSGIRDGRPHQRNDLRHHVLDRQPEVPCDGPWRTASAAAASCLDANAASVAAIFKGEAAPAWLLKRHLPVRLVGCDGRVVNLPGWPEPEVAA